jgi:electron transfer flavoprotein alpha subunit
LISRTPGRPTGTTVRLGLYRGGISGAIQHRAGMDKSNKIIAINTDRCPDLQVAHTRSSVTW